jgi:hypothetical protein
MGTSTNAMLVYGYHLGGDEDGWLFEGLDEWGTLPDGFFDWYDKDSEDSSGFLEDAQDQLLARVAGFTETDWRADGYFARKREAEAQLGVEIESHCSGDYPMYLLVAKAITAYRGDVEEIDFQALAEEVHGADIKLRLALDALGIRPTQEQAQWLLCSYWG